jgi:hypothetical protein
MQHSKVAEGHTIMNTRTKTKYKTENDTRVCFDRGDDKDRALQESLSLQQARGQDNEDESNSVTCGFHIGDWSF